MFFKHTSFLLLLSAIITNKTISTKTPFPHKVTKISAKNYLTFDEIRNDEIEIKSVRKNFYIDIHEVSFEKFNNFVQFTNYKTEAEKIGWSFVLERYATPLAEVSARKAVKDAPHWLKVDGADFRHPFGPLDDNFEFEIDPLKHEKLNEQREKYLPKPKDPVTHVTWKDAHAYCSFAINGRLPTEDEWELAARGGKEIRLYPWGDKFIPEKLNIWNGEKWFERPDLDNFEIYAPVEDIDNRNTFRPQNKFGLYHISGNVWEMTSTYHFEDRFDAVRLSDPEQFYPEDVELGPRAEVEFLSQEGYDPSNHFLVKKGGSFMCHKDYCDMYKLHKRSGNSKDSSALNLGFRCVSESLMDNMIEVDYQGRDITEEQDQKRNEL